MYRSHDLSHLECAHIYVDSEAHKLIEVKVNFCNPNFGIHLSLIRGRKRIANTAAERSCLALLDTRDTDCLHLRVQYIFVAACLTNRQAKAMSHQLRTDRSNHHRTKSANDCIAVG